MAWRLAKIGRLERSRTSVFVTDLGQASDMIVYHPVVPRRKPKSATHDNHATPYGRRKSQMTASDVFSFNK
jgi:hypothetical protein